MLGLISASIVKGDMQALEDLTYEKRKDFLRKYHLPKELPLVSFHTEASISPAVLATLSRVAHAELPAFSPGQATTLPVVIPLGAAMAACAQLLQIRYGEKSDGLVTCRDAEVPGSIVVRPKRKLDHAWMVYSSLNDDPMEADASQVCEALLTLLVEAGMKKRHELTKKDEWGFFGLFTCFSFLEYYFVFLGYDDEIIYSFVLFNWLEYNPVNYDKYI